MQKDLHNDVFTVGIGGAAGDGVLEAGSNLGIILKDLGYEVYMSSNYPSLIRGGHNFVRLSFGKEKIWNDHTQLDVLIALNEETVKLHTHELNENAFIFADKFDSEDLEKLGSNATVVPMLYSVKKLSLPDITRNSVALGALCYLLDLSLKSMKNVVGHVFEDKMPEANIKLAEIGFDHLALKQIRHSKKLESSEPGGEFIDGNMAFSRGLIAAGLDFYVAYPMTPASTILHYLARKQTPGGPSSSAGQLKVIQPESELSVINMALGMIYTGKRVAIGSATGGFALMHEAFSFAGMAEFPLVVAVSQRQAPATGVPTHSSQSDLRFAIHAGHGEFPRIVMAPGDPEECFRAADVALNLAWKFQIPVIVLLDKILSEHMITCVLPEKSVYVDKGKIAENTDENYGRYKFSDDGVSPMAFPGTLNTTVKVTSYEHDEYGITTEKVDEVKKMIEKRFSKIKGIEENMKGRETIKVYHGRRGGEGDLESENAVVFFGSTKSPILEASKYFEKGIKLIQIIWVEPFPVEKVMKELEGKKRIICVEGNHNGQLSALIREKTGIEKTHEILKYDSLPFDPIELSKQINEIIK